MPVTDLTEAAGTSTSSAANFLGTSAPPPVTLDEFDPSGPDRFFNRELSWLAFNCRVLEEAENPNVPLLERLRFVSISAANLDEFYTVRVAGLRELAREGNTTPAADGLTPAQQLVMIDRDARVLMQTQQKVFGQLRREMEDTGIRIVTRNRLTRADRSYLEQVFLTQVFPVLSPLAIDPAHPFPFIPNTGLVQALMLERKSDNKELRALLPIPQQINRFVRLPSKPDEHRFLLLEDLLLLHLGSLFPGYRLVGDCQFRVLRDSDLEVEEEA
jgi:polyphosphate kinase